MTNPKANYEIKDTPNGVHYHFPNTVANPSPTIGQIAVSTRRQMRITASLRAQNAQRRLRAQLALTSVSVTSASAFRAKLNELSAS